MGDAIPLAALHTFGDAIPPFGEAIPPFGEAMPPARHNLGEAIPPALTTTELLNTDVAKAPMMSIDFKILFLFITLYTPLIEFSARFPPRYRV